MQWDIVLLFAINAGLLIPVGILPWLVARNEEQPDRRQTLRLLWLRLPWLAVLTVGLLNLVATGGMPLDWPLREWVLWTAVGLEIALIMLLLVPTKQRLLTAVDGGLNVFLTFWCFIASGQVPPI